MLDKARTSDSHPIRVDWLPVPWAGKVGLTFAPGKKQPDAATGIWHRDLTTDLKRIREHYGADHLVCLLEQFEMPMLGIGELPVAAAKAGIRFHHFPVEDQETPRDAGGVRALVAEIAGWAAAGENVVIHCKGGLGRAGTIGGCVLRHAGLSGEEALDALAEARAPYCPHTWEQRRYVELFRPGAAGWESRVVGSVLGAAIGDALGHPTEFMSAREIRSHYGPKGVDGFKKWWEQDGRRFAPYTDDTQMAEIVLASLLEHSEEADMEPVMRTMAEGFAKWSYAPQGGHRGPGNACLTGALRLVDGVHWREAGGPTAGGCGSVMRAYPFGLRFADDLERAERWAVEHSYMTHGDPIALAACAAMAVGMAHEVRGAGGAQSLAAMVEAAGRHDLKTAKLTEAALADAANGTEPEVVLEYLQGWAAHEAIAAAMYVVSRHGDDPRAALLEGANAPGDSDSIATLVGALMGARMGAEALPQDWVRDVERSEELRRLGLDAARLFRDGG